MSTTSESSEKRRVAVLGLGIIGSTWARHFADDGLLAGAWNRTPKPDFPRWTPDPAAAVAEADVVVLVVADPPAVDAVLDQIEPSLGERHTVIQSTTIDPRSSARFQRRVTDTGAAYIEAPFTGSKPAAVARKVVFYLGGDAEAIRAAEPVLERISEVRLHIGTGEQAAALKLAMNLQISLQAAALCESLHVARAAGIHDDVFFGALRKNAAWSGLTTLKEPKLREGDFTPQFSVKHMLKDMKLLANSEHGQSLSLARGIVEELQRAADGGLAEEDFIALIKQAGK